MSSTTDKLVEIQSSEWPKLCDLYADERISCYAYNLLQTTMNYIRQNPQLDIHIYSLNGDWERDGTFLLNNHNSITIHTLSASNDRCLKALDCLDCKPGFFFSGFQERFIPAARQHFINLGISLDAFKLCGTFWYHATKEQVQQFNIDSPTGITLAPLQPQHAEEVHSLWPHTAHFTAKTVERLIRYNISVGAYNGNGQLMAWTVQLSLGCIGILQVVDEHKRKGLGSLVVRCLSKQLAAKNFEVFAPVVFANVASRSLFEGQGFRLVGNLYFVNRPGQEKC